MSIIARIDFFSFSLQADSPTIEVVPLWEGIPRSFLLRHLPDITGGDVELGDAWVSVTPNRPYKRAMQHRESKLRVEWGNVDTVLVMMPGTACEIARQNGLLEGIIERYQARASRIDFAVDMLCSQHPENFARDRQHNKFKSLSHFEEESGVTWYVGSWSSDRFARVYRYAEPHPRAKWLRAEHVFKGKQAKKFALACVKHGLEHLVEPVGKIYGWRDAAWQPEISTAAAAEAVKAWLPERHASKTLRWLEETCAPALVRLVQQGEIVDVDQWLRDFVYSQLNSRDDGSVAAPITYEE